MMRNEERLLRRQKSDADRDALHTIRVGLVIFIVLWIILPVLLR
ncbi:hypothetical protein O9Z70_13525 [Devosia sp. YIM 151766]|nr:hypothetical protein [Devosia sp. YIM 151766]WIY52469.1 hypothetical protein O9Z70_13525 [Devosia sp. YIM 151766]